MRIIKIATIALFLLIISYVGWIIFDKINDRSKREANENNAVRTLKQIHNAQIKAKAKFGKYVDLNTLVKENAVNSELENSKFSGYKFSVKSEDQRYSALASRNPGEGNLSFYLDETGVIRSSDKLIAGPDDIPSKLQNLVE